MRRTFTAEEKASVFELWKNGTGFSEIANILGSKPGTIFTMLRDTGGIKPHERKRAVAHLPLSEREEIRAGLSAKMSIRAIATALNRSPSTISREVQRNRGRRYYKAVDANNRANRMAKRPKPCLLDQNLPLRKLVLEKLEMKWSPEQISGWLRRTKPRQKTLRISPETIYKTLYFRSREALHHLNIQHLRRSHSLRHGRRHTRKGERGTINIVNGTPIHERSRNIDNRRSLGHWEGDLVSGTKNSHIATLVDRKSRYTIILRLRGKDSVSVNQALTDKFLSLPSELRKSLTWDRGMELARHLEFTVSTGVKVYFCDPQSPWQRCEGGVRPPLEKMMPLLDKLREQYGVGPLCSELHIAPSTYYHCQQQRHHPDKRSARAQRDDWLKKEIQRVYDENHKVYGVRKVWRQLLREGIRVARCTVARLMAVMGLAGVLRGKKVRTTISRKAVAAGDRVNRQFVAERPDQLWVADFTYVSTWRGFVYVAFIIDVFAGYIVGWRVSSSMETTFVLDALEQALWARRPSGTVHHSDKGSQYVSLAYTQRLKEAGLLASTGSTGDSYDNAMAESINGLYKAEVIHRKSWKNRAEVELATLTWVDWYNNRRLLERLGHTPPAEAEKAYYASIGNDDLAA